MSDPGLTAKICKYFFRYSGIMTLSLNNTCKGVKSIFTQQCTLYPYNLSWNQKPNQTQRTYLILSFTSTSLTLHSSLKDPESSLSKIFHVNIPEEYRCL